MRCSAIAHPIWRRPQLALQLIVGRCDLSSRSSATIFPGPS